MKSPEFTQSMGKIMEQPRAPVQRHPFHLPHIPVETEVSAEVLKKMFGRIQNEWEHLGETEPYWSVVTQPQYYQAEFQKHREAFYASGSHSCELFLAAVRRAGVNPSTLHTCLEVGCGVGRVTQPLAITFKKVVAIDISRPHLAVAQEYMKEKGICNVELQHLERLEQLNNLPSVDAIFSLITLQHNPPPVIAWTLSTLLLRLNPGGVAYFQLPTYRNGYIFEAERYLQSAPPDTLEMHFLPQVAVFKLIAQAGCECLEVREDGMVGEESIMLSNTFLIRKF